MYKIEYILREILILFLLSVLIICVTCEPVGSDNLNDWIMTMAASKAWALIAGICLWAVVRFWTVNPHHKKDFFGIEDDENEDYWI